MLDKYPKLELIAITYGYDKVEEVTERTAIISNGYFHELHISCDDASQKYAMKIVNRVFNSTNFSLITYNYENFLFEFEKTLKAMVNSTLKESMRMARVDWQEDKKMTNLTIVNWSDYFMIDVCDLNGKLRFSYMLNNTGTKRIILKVSDKELENFNYFVESLRELKMN